MRRFEMVEGTSSKFWEVDVEGKNLVVRFGRLGTDGQTKSKPFGSAALAQKEAEKLIREKMVKGYVEAGKKAAKPKPALTPRAPKAPRASGAFSFSKELDELYAKGWPHLRIFKGIEKLLVAQKGDPKKERKVMDQAYAQYMDLRAAMGEVIPEAYFTHAFADVTPNWKADEKTSHRWIELAVEAASA